MEISTPPPSPDVLRTYIHFQPHIGLTKKSWMTSALFIKWIRGLDKKFLAQKRKILMFVDNCSANPQLKNLQSTTLHFFPPNTTSVLQPMDQGIMYNLKTKYRQRFTKYILKVVLKLSRYFIFSVISLACFVWSFSNYDNYSCRLLINSTGTEMACGYYWH